jgi:hypothetical protein
MIKELKIVRNKNKLKILLGMFKRFWKTSINENDLTHIVKYAI